MTLEIEFKTEGADAGEFLVRGLPAVWSEVLVAIQRLADGRYLTMHGLWDENASWYPCPRLDSNDAEARFATGQVLTRGIGAAAGERLQVHLRRRDFSDTGPLVFRDVPSSPPTHAIEPDQMGSVATQVGNWQGAPPVIPPVIPPAGQPIVGDRAPEREQPPTMEPTEPTPANDQVRVRHEDPRSSAGPTASMAVTRSTSAATRLTPTRPPLPGPWAMLALFLICGIALFWWSLDTETDGPPRPPSPSHPTGKALYLALKDQDLAPQDLFEQAERAAEGGDCEAAIRIFVDAARRDPGLTVQLGRRYDPAEFRPTPCFAEPNADSAQVWYQRAAEAGITEAQRRYGELLLGEANSGPVYQDAIAWLRKAVAAGDAAAADRLMALGER